MISGNIGIIISSANMEIAQNYVTSIQIEIETEDVYADMIVEDAGLSDYPEDHPLLEKLTPD